MSVCLRKYGFRKLCCRCFPKDYQVILLKGDVEVDVGLYEDANQCLLPFIEWHRRSWRCSRRSYLVDASGEVSGGEEVWLELVKECRLVDGNCSRKTDVVVEATRRKVAVELILVFTLDFGNDILCFGSYE
ncbi:hypothetical protein V6N11_046152 [Hibiscus sabdariffa]|uniref:Uncharacterized protein n=1 Tax=Hibiscus sabdariffa TaxID=183260 RepID=A0ABR1ZLD8_9ROSI